MTTRLEKAYLAQAGALFALGALLSIVNRPFFEQSYIREDGLLEWLTMLALASAAFAVAARLWRHRARANLRQRFVWCGIALLFAFGAGEEISWGQRLFAIESPEFFLERNAQGETNLHNLVVGEVKINKLVFGNILFALFFLYLCVLTPLHHRVPRIRAWIDAWGVPVPQRYHWVGYVTVFLVVEVLVNLLSDTPKRGELTEFGISALAALNVTFPCNRAGREPFHAPADTGDPAASPASPAPSPTSSPAPPPPPETARD